MLRTSDQFMLGIIIVTVIFTNIKISYFLLFPTFNSSPFLWLLLAIYFHGLDSSLAFVIWFDFWHIPNFDSCFCPWASLAKSKSHSTRSWQLKWEDLPGVKNALELPTAAGSHRKSELMFLMREFFHF